MQDRRQLLTGSFGSFCVYALLAEARAATPGDTRVSAARWIARQDELARGLRDGMVSQTAWHDAVNALAREVDVAALAAEIRRSDVKAAGDPFGHDPQKRFVAFRDEQGKPVRVAYATALFSFSQARAITPHAHKHMASAHMVLEGGMLYFANPAPSDRSRPDCEISSRDPAARMIRRANTSVRHIG